MLLLGRAAVTGSAKSLSLLELRRPLHLLWDVAEMLQMRLVMAVRQPIIKYSLHSTTGTWIREQCSLQVAKDIFAVGSFRVAKKAVLIDDEGYASLQVVKFLKEQFSENAPAICFTDVVVQSLAELFAQEFNKVYWGSKISFVPTCVIEFISATYSDLKSPPFAVMEPFLAYEKKGFQKYNDNQGGFQSDSYSAQVANAFSHFSYVASGGELVVCDIQGIGEYYTDPQIHTAMLPSFLDTFHPVQGTNSGGRMPFEVFQNVWQLENISSLGLGNFGWEGLERFIKSHVCNSVCAALGLEPLLKHDSTLLSRNSCVESSSRFRRDLNFTACTSWTSFRSTWQNILQVWPSTI